MKSGKYLRRTGSRPYCAASFTEGTGEQHALCSVPGTCATLHSPLPDLDCSPCGRLLIAALQPQNLSLGVSPCCPTRRPGLSGARCPPALRAVPLGTLLLQKLLWRRMCCGERGGSRKRLPAMHVLYFEP